MPPLTPSPSSAKTGSQLQVPAAPPSSFAAFVLDRVARNPFLINETPTSLTSSANNTNSSPCAPSTLDPAQQALLRGAADAATRVKLPSPPVAPLAATSTAVGEEATTTTAAATTAILQRALVDAPLLPFGGAHLLHELVWTNFVVCAEAARQVGCFTKAIALHEARQQKETEQQAESASTATASTFGATPLAVDQVSPTSTSPAARGATSPAGTAFNGGSSTGSCLTAEELSCNLTLDLLRVRLTQAQARLTDSKAALQRGLAKLRRLVEKMSRYDALSAEELRARQQAVVDELTSPIEPQLDESSAAPLERERAAALVLGGVGAEQERKRPRLEK